jgi:hypothetical protein
MVPSWVIGFPFIFFPRSLVQQEGVNYRPDFLLREPVIHGGEIKLGDVQAVKVNLASTDCRHTQQVIEELKSGLNFSFFSD